MHRKTNYKLSTYTLKILKSLSNTQKLITPSNISYLYFKKYAHMNTPTSNLVMDIDPIYAI